MNVRYAFLGCFFERAKDIVENFISLMFIPRSSTGLANEVVDNIFYNLINILNKMFIFVVSFVKKTYLMAPRRIAGLY